jgi:hypothetical protein
MAIVVMIICVIMWAFIHAHMQDQGVAPRSRGSLRYQRHKARKLNVDPADLRIRSREQPWVKRSTITGSHVGDLKRGLAGGCLLIFTMAAWVIFWFGNRSWIGDAWFWIGLVAIWLLGWLIDMKTRPSNK